MANFHFELVSPERLVFEGEVEHVVVPGGEGEYGVLAGHSPFVSSLKAGILTILGGGAPKRMFVRGGFAEAGPEGLSVLAEVAVPVEELDAGRIASEIKAAEEDVADAKSETAKRKAEARLNELKEVKAVLGH